MREIRSVKWLARWIGKSPATPSPSLQLTGMRGEAEAARYLKRNGFKILVRRYRCRFGEIDLTARDDDTLVFIEVKTRTSLGYGDPSEAVTPEKQRHISRVALDYLRRLENPDIPVRFDIVEVIQKDGWIDCNHIENAFPISEPYLG